MQFGTDDINFMRIALAEADFVKGKTFPNPAVGALIVDCSGNVIGRGATQKAGSDHAEIVALKQAGTKALGATLYVTLEPCCHYGRTPPCCKSIVESGIKRVVFAVEDPNPLVAGNGKRFLEENGVEVLVGPLGNEARALNEDFFWSITHKKAWVTLKLALTLDGRIADCWNDSKWITSDESREVVHEFRRCHAAVAVGKNTLIHDNPRLNVRHKEGFSPARIVFSTNCEIPKSSFFYKNASETRTIVVVSSDAAFEIVKESSGIEFWYTGEADFEKSLNKFLETAFSENITSVFFEGGQQLASQLLEFKLVNRLHLFYGNRLVGNGCDGVKFRGGLRISDCISLDNISHKIIGADLLISGIPVYSRQS